MGSKRSGLGEVFFAGTVGTLGEYRAVFGCCVTPEMFGIVRKAMVNGYLNLGEVLLSEVRAKVRFIWPAGKDASRGLWHFETP
jgi:hypothetical protein